MALKKEDNSRIVMDRRVWIGWNEFCAGHPTLGGRAPEQVLQQLMVGVMKLGGSQWLNWMNNPPDPHAMTLVEVEDDKLLAELHKLTLEMFNE